MLTLVSCAAGPDKLISIYEDGADKAASATSQTELYELSLEIDSTIKSAASGIGSDKKMSVEDTRKVLSAKQRYENALERAATRLNYPKKNGSVWAQ